MKLKRKLILLASVSACILVFFTSYSLATSTGTITADTVRMREKPTTSSQILLNLDQDEKVEVIEKSDDWYKISFNGSEGYVSAKYISVAEEKVEKTTENETAKQEETTASNENATQEENEEKTEKQENREIQIAVSSVQKLKRDSKIYSLPLISTGISRDIKKDEQVTVLQVLKNWVYVSTDSISGWVKKQDLLAVENNTSETVTETEAKNNTETTEPKQEETAVEPKEQTKIGYINVETANLREKATTDSEIVDSLSLNDKITIVSEDGDWYKVTIGNKEGYIYKKLVSDKKTEQTTSRSGEDRTQSAKKTEQVVEETSQQEEVTPSDETQPVETADSSSDVATGANIVAFAKKFLGCKYVSGGNGPTSFDCSGFTSYVYRHFGYSLSRTSGGQASNGVAVDKSELQQGDIVVFLNSGKTKIGHVGIYIGGNTFIHAANSSKGVITESLSSSYYAQRYVTARRII